MDSPWSRSSPRFGAHQFREKLDGNLVYLTWFAGGLRIVDISDPSLPKEAGYYIPEPVNGQPAPQSNDVDLDNRGLIYLIDRLEGFDILQYRGSGSQGSERESNGRPAGLGPPAWQVSGSTEAFRHIPTFAFAASSGPKYQKSSTFSSSGDPCSWPDFESTAMSVSAASTLPPSQL
jgi:LVIVD repeat